MSTHNVLNDLEAFIEEQRSKGNLEVLQPVAPTEFTFEIEPKNMNITEIVKAFELKTPEEMQEKESEYNPLDDYEQYEWNTEAGVEKIKANLKECNEILEYIKYNYKKRYWKNIQTQLDTLHASVYNLLG